MLRGIVHDPRANRMEGVAGHAGLFTTAADLARYARMLLNGGTLDYYAYGAQMTNTLPIYVGSGGGTLQFSGAGSIACSANAYDRARSPVFTASWARSKYASAYFGSLSMARLRCSSANACWPRFQ